MNYLAMGAQVLQDKMEQYGGIEVQYRRPGSFSFYITVVPGRNPTDVIDQNGTVLRLQIFDFIATIEKMKARMTSGEKRPMRGDELVVEVAKEKVVFMVNGEDVATSHYEPADSYGYAWRIHTKSDRILS